MSNLSGAYLFEAKIRNSNLSGSDLYNSVCIKTDFSNSNLSYSIFDEAYKLCLVNREKEKYLMTFQNLLSRIPKWNEELISNEVERITNNSGCGYLEDLITCVHVVQLKALTCIRVGQKQKKVDIDIPKLNDFETGSSVV